MRRKLLLGLCLLLMCGDFLKAQTGDMLIAAPDSTKVFSLESYYNLIINNHPTARQANLLPEFARQEIRLARGSFDPKLEAQLSSKQLNGKEYYDIFNSTLKFPTIFPFDPSIGIDRNKGAYLNPERYIDGEFNYHQVYAGVSIPLGRGLITDERRAALRQAELLKDLNEAEKVKQINKLLLDAAKLYWDWYYAYYNYILLNRSVDLAQEIFKRVKGNYTYGEASVVDTVQANITLQQRLIDQQEALLNFKNSGVEISNMLWDSVGNPLDLDLTWVPAVNTELWSLTSDDLLLLTEQARANHPELRKIEVKLNQLEIEKRLSTEYLKPQLNLNYYALNQPLNPEGASSFVMNDNYKLGIDFSFPIFLRKERSKVALAKLKINNTKLEQDITERQIINNITSVYNQLNTIQAVMTTQRQMVLNYERLLEAELTNLANGESDLFKINVQQDKLIQVQTKWLKLLAENEKLKAQLYWAAGSSRLQRN